MLKNTEKISHTRKSCVRQGEKRVKEERKKEEEEERRGTEAEVLPNHDRDHSLRRFLVLCSSYDRQLVFFFKD